MYLLGPVLITSGILVRTENTDARVSSMSGLFSELRAYRFRLYLLAQIFQQGNLLLSRGCWASILFVSPFLPSSR